MHMLATHFELHTFEPANNILVTLHCLLIKPQVSLANALTHQSLPLSYKQNRLVNEDSDKNENL